MAGLTNRVHVQHSDAGAPLLNRWDGLKTAEGVEMEISLF
jgi:hypothetical protein